MTKAEAKVIKAAMRLSKDWPDTSPAGMLRRIGFDDVADVIARIQKANAELLKKRKGAK